MVSRQERVGGRRGGREEEWRRMGVRRVQRVIEKTLPLNFLFLSLTGLSL